MTPENFCYWLKGFDEITNGQPPGPAQWEVIRKHLALVFLQVIDSPAILQEHEVTQQELDRYLPDQVFPEYCVGGLRPLINPDLLKPTC